MEYIVKVNGKEYGPIEDDILVRWVEDGRVLSDSHVRNSKLNNWKRADDFEFLRDAFKTQQARFKKILDNTENTAFPSNPTRILKLLPKEDKKDTTGDFKNSFRPDKAGILVRLKAGIADLVFVFTFFYLSLIITSYFAESLNTNNFVIICLLIFSIHFFLVLLYFGTALGVFAQTVGMWYYGLILVRNGEEANEVFLLRAYFYTIFMCIFWVISPIINYILGKKRALHDIITDTQIVKISARKI